MAALSASIFNANGSLNPAGILSSAFKEIEFRSSASPNYVMNLEAAAAGAGPPNPFMAWLRPTLILRTIDGTETTIAPAGPSGGGSILPAVAVVAVLFGLGYAFARLTS
jgi:hypothetical protein